MNNVRTIRPLAPEVTRADKLEAIAAFEHRASRLLARAADLRASMKEEQEFDDDQCSFHRAGGCGPCNYCERDE